MESPEREDDSFRNPKPTISEKLFELLSFMAKKEQAIEVLRNRLARMDSFEPRQAFERVARDQHRMEARDIFYFVGRFEEPETHTIDACHYLIRYWCQTKQRIGFKEPTAEEGSISLTDFCQLVLPHDNTILRATASQRVTHKASVI